METEFIDIHVSELNDKTDRDIDQYMKDLNHKSRINRKLVRLTIPTHHYSRIFDCPSNRGKLISEFTDEELNHLRFTNIPAKSASNLADVIIVQDYENNTATIKDRRSTGYQIIRH